MDPGNSLDGMKMFNLYGGAIQCSLPARFTDASMFRQIPDHQEVLSDPNCDQSVIIEINQYQPVSDSDCPKYFWDDLLQAAEAMEVSPPELFGAVCPRLRAQHVVCAAIGRQRVSKYRDEATNIVQVCMAIIRLPQHVSDICLFVNTPVAVDEKSSAAGNRH